MLFNLLHGRLGSEWIFDDGKSIELLELWSTAGKTNEREIYWYSQGWATNTDRGASDVTERRWKQPSIPDFILYNYIPYAWNLGITSALQSAWSVEHHAIPRLQCLLPLALLHSLGSLAGFIVVS